MKILVLGGGVTNSLLFSVTGTVGTAIWLYNSNARVGAATGYVTNPQQYSQCIWRRIQCQWRRQNLVLNNTVFNVGATNILNGTLTLGASDRLWDTTTKILSRFHLAQHFNLNGYNENHRSLAGAGNVTLGGRHLNHWCQLCQHHLQRRDIR